MDSERQSWELEGCSLTVSCDESAMESMRQASIVGLQKVPRRGLEIGGILFGRRDGNHIEILEWREIACEHAKGPGFDLSEVDERLLEGMLVNARVDPHLSQMEVVGWFRTRTKGPVFLSDADAAFLRKYFQEPSQIVLVIRPHMYEPAQAGIFLPGEEGETRAESNRVEFQLENRRRRLPASFDPSQRPGKPSVAADAPPPREQPPMDQIPLPLEEEPPGEMPNLRVSSAEPIHQEAAYPDPAGGKRHPVSNRMTVAGVVATILLAIIGVLVLPAIDSPAGPPAGLQIRDAGEHLIVSWAASTPSGAGIDGASLRILDGAEERVVELRPDELLRGSLVYHRVSGDVEVELRVPGSGGVDVIDMARFIGEGPVGAGSAPGETGTQAMREQLETLRGQLEAETAHSDALRRSIDTEKRRMGIEF